MAAATALGVGAHYCVRLANDLGEQGWANGANVLTTVNVQSTTHSKTSM